MAKERTAKLKALRDQAAANTARMQLAHASSGNEAVSPDMLRGVTRTALEQMRLDGGETTCKHWSPLRAQKRRRSALIVLY